MTPHNLWTGGRPKFNHGQMMADRKKRRKKKKIYMEMNGGNRIRPIAAARSVDLPE